MCNIDYDFERIATSTDELTTLFQLTENSLTQDNRPVPAPEIQPNPSQESRYAKTRPA